MIELPIYRYIDISTAKLQKKNDIHKCIIIFFHFFRNIGNIHSIRTPHISVSGLRKHTVREAKANDVPSG